MDFFYHKDLGNHLLQLCPKVVKHPVYCNTVRDGGQRVGLVGTVVAVTVHCVMSQLSLLQMHCFPCSFILNKLKTINRDK